MRVSGEGWVRTGEAVTSTQTCSRQTHNAGGHRTLARSTQIHGHKESAYRPRIPTEHTADSRQKTAESRRAGQRTANQQTDRADRLSARQT